MIVSLARLAALALLLACAASARGEEGPIERGKRAFARRAQGFALTGRPDAAAVGEALAAYEEAVAADPSSIAARLRLTEALEFEGEFLIEGARSRKKAFDRLADFAEETVRLVESAAASERDWRSLSVPERAERLAREPEAVEAHFWAAIAWGLWGMSHAKAASGFKGVAARIREHGEMVVALDERHRDAGGLRVLGRLHAATPKLPLFTAFIDPETGIVLLERANAISTSEARNPLFLAEALLAHAPARREEALDLLRGLSARTPDPRALVEQTQVLAEARERLRRETEQAP